MQKKKKLQRSGKENLSGKLSRGFMPVQIISLFSHDRNDKSGITEARQEHIPAFQAAYYELVSVGPIEPEVQAILVAVWYDINNIFFLGFNPN